MKNIIAVLLLGLGLVLASPASADLTGTTVAGNFACAVPDLSTESKALLNLWITLNQKLQAGTITDEEYDQGAMLSLTGTCGVIAGDLPVRIARIDGVDYLIEVQEGVFLIIKSDGVTENE